MDDKCIKQYVDDRMALYNGDSAVVLKGIPSDSVHFMIYSPPFASLYTYSNSERDLGNCKDLEEFYTQFKFIVDELYRILMPGRIMAVHCMQFPTQKGRDGFIGLQDFRGDLIRLFQKSGFYYHSEVNIWKDPVVQMQRTKALGLLHKQIKKDSAMSRQGLSDYLVVMRKPGDNPEPISHTNDTFPVSEWQKYASPVWMDINPSDTLQSKSCRDDKDEKHICPLQLSVIRRAIDLWSNPNETVLTPFLGIGSEAYVALEKGRRAIGVELKTTWFEQAVRNCKGAVTNQRRFLLRGKNMRIVVIILAVFVIVLGCLCWKLLQDNASLTIINLIHQETEKELKERLKDNETTKLS